MNFLTIRNNFCSIASEIARREPRLAESMATVIKALDRTPVSDRPKFAEEVMKTGERSFHIRSMRMNLAAVQRFSKENGDEAQAADRILKSLDDVVTACLHLN
jgi:hypothetical protein